MVLAPPVTYETGAAQASGHRARAAPPHRWRSPARSAQRCESGGKVRSTSGGCCVTSVLRFLLGDGFQLLALAHDDAALGHADDAFALHGFELHIHALA